MIPSYKDGFSTASSKLSNTEQPISPRDREPTEAQSCGSHDVTHAYLTRMRSRWHRRELPQMESVGDEEPGERQRNSDK